MSLNFKFRSDMELDFYKRVLKYEESLVKQKQALQVRETYVLNLPSTISLVNLRLFIIIYKFLHCDQF